MCHLKALLFCCILTAMPSGYKAAAVQGLDTKGIKKWSVDDVCLWNEKQSRGDFEVVQCGYCDNKMQQKNYNKHCYKFHGKQEGDVLNQLKMCPMTKEWIPSKKNTKRRRTVEQKRADLERERKKQKTITGYWKVTLFKNMYENKSKNNGTIIVKKRRGTRGKTK